MKKFLTEKSSLVLLLSGFVLLFAGLSLFLWNDYQVDINQKVNAPKAGQLGDFIGGIVGSIWALAGVILFYVALTEQRKDFNTNREVLNAQLDALKLQIEEFELQRKAIQMQTQEMTENRKANEEQAKAQSEQVRATNNATLINARSAILNSQTMLLQIASDRGASTFDTTREHVIMLNDELGELITKLNILP